MLAYYYYYSVQIQQVCKMNAMHTHMYTHRAPRTGRYRLP